MYKKPLKSISNSDAISDNETPRLCRHKRKKVAKCSPAQLMNVPCTDWDNQQNEQETLTRDGRPYTPALVEKCPDCRWAAMLNAIDEKEKRDRARGGGTNGTNGVHGLVEFG